MTTIGSIIEEKVKTDLNYEHKPWELPQKLFKNLSTLCILNNVPILMDGKRINRVKIELYSGNNNKSYGTYDAKPVVKDERMYLSIRFNEKKTPIPKEDLFWGDGSISLKHIKPGEVLIDAAFAFGEEVHKV